MIGPLVAPKQATDENLEAGDRRPLAVAHGQARRESYGNPKAGWELRSQEVPVGSSTDKRRIARLPAAPWVLGLPGPTHGHQATSTISVSSPSHYHGCRAAGTGSAMGKAKRLVRKVASWPWLCGGGNETVTA